MSTFVLSNTLALLPARLKRVPAPMQRQRHLTHGEALEALVTHIVDSLGKKRVPLYHLDAWMEHSGLAFCYGVESIHFNDDRSRYGSFGMGEALEAFLPHAEAVLQTANSQSSRCR